MENFKFGLVEIEGMEPVLFCAEPQRSITDADAIFSYSDIEKEYGEDALALKDAYIASEVERTKKLGVMFDNNSTYRVLSIKYSRVERDGERVRIPSVVLAPTNFFDFVGFKAISDEMKHEEYRCSVLNGTDIDVIPMPVTLGTNTFVLTSDNNIILSARSGRNYPDKGVLNGFHVSVAEGMLRPNDNANPFNSVIRGLYEELFIDESLYDTGNIRLLGVWFDSVRFQFNATFVVDVGASFDSINRMRKLAPDSRENDHIIKLPVDPKVIASSITGNLCSGEDYYVPVSNHVRASLLTLMYHYFSLDEIGILLGERG